MNDQHKNKQLQETAMKSLQTLAVTFFTFALTTNSAWAYNFGFVRAPDWMDPYVVILLIFQLPFWLIVMITKPKTIGFKELFQRQAELGTATRFYYRICQVLFALLMILVFTGMALARM